MTNVFEYLTLAMQLATLLEQVKEAQPGQSETLPPIKVKVSGKHYTLDINLTRVD